MLDNTLSDSPPVENAQPGAAPANNLNILPIRYWWITFVLVVLFIGGISGWQRLFQGHVEVPPAGEYNIERLKHPAKGLRVVSVGDSYSRFAFPFDSKFDKMALEQGVSLKLTRFTKNNGKQRHFAVLLPHIIEAKPDFVFLEAEPFIMDSLRRSSTFLESFRQGIRNIKKRFVGHKSRGLFEENSMVGPERTDDLTTKPEMVENRIRGMKKGLIVAAPKMPEVFEEFFKKARAQGTQVVLLDLGHSKVVNEAFPTEFHDQVTANLARLEARYPIEVWRFPSNLPLTHYKDVAHLNVNGQRVFVKWLLTRLMDKVEEK